MDQTGYTGHQTFLGFLVCAFLEGKCDLLRTLSYIVDRIAGLN